MHDPDGEGDAQEDQFVRAHGRKRAISAAAVAPPPGAVADEREVDLVSATISTVRGDGLLSRPGKTDGGSGTHPNVEFVLRLAAEG
jgi:hypothetical protein